MRNNRGSSEIAEFGPVVYVLFLIVLLPLLDLSALLVAGATQFLTTNDLAAKAATQANYSASLSSMVSEAYRFQSNGLARFVHMVPEGGYTGCGDDMYVLTTDLASGTVTSSEANQTVGSPVNTSAAMYELSIKSIYNVSPLVSLDAVPVLQNVPGIGKPATLTFIANRPVEHPGGLESSPQGGVGSGGGGGNVNPFNRVSDNPNNMPPPSPITWRNPNIFQQIQNAGQTVVNVAVVNVQANYNQSAGAPPGGWVNTGVTLQAGQNVWLDTQATGNWGCPDGSPSGEDAKGTPGTLNNYASYDLDYNNMYLLGYIGTPPILPYGFSSGGTKGDPHFVPSGNFLLNYPVKFSGPLSMGCNDNQLDDFGSQMVRIIITQ